MSVSEEDTSRENEKVRKMVSEKAKRNLKIVVRQKNECVKKNRERKCVS